MIPEARIGVDVGGSKIAAITLDKDGSVVSTRRTVTPRDYQGTLTAIAELVLLLEDELGRRTTVGIGMPGALSPVTGLVKNANSTWLIGKPLDRDLEALLKRPLRFENDANCFALSEAFDGAAAGARVVFGVIVGTGTGGGLVIDGNLWRGVNAIAGEWGHNPLPSPRPEETPGPDCYCGCRGCIETFLCGPGLARDYEGATGRKLEPSVVARAADGGEPEAEAALQRYEDRMARALATVINLLDPEVIVLGGGLSHIERLYRNVPHRWSRYVFSDRVTTKLVCSAHGEWSGARGAARLWDL